MFSGKKDFSLLHTLSDHPFNFSNTLGIYSIFNRKYETYAYDLLCHGKNILRAREFKSGIVTEYLNGKESSHLSGLNGKSLVALQLHVDQGSGGNGMLLSGADITFFLRTSTDPSRAECEIVANQLGKLISDADIWVFMRRDGEFREEGGPHFDIFGRWPSPSAYQERHRTKQKTKRTTACVLNRNGKISFSK